MFDLFFLIRHLSLCNSQKKKIVSSEFININFYCLSRSTQTRICGAKSLLSNQQLIGNLKTKEIWVSISKI